LSSGAFFVFTTGNSQGFVGHADVGAMTVSVRTLAVLEAFYAGVHPKEFCIADHAREAVVILCAYTGFFSWTAFAFVADTVIFGRAGCPDFPSVFTDIIITILIAVAVVVFRAIHTCVHIENRGHADFARVAI